MRVMTDPMRDVYRSDVLELKKKDEQSQQAPPLTQIHTHAVVQSDNSRVLNMFIISSI